MKKYNGSNYGEVEASGNIKQTSIPNKSLETYDDVRVTYFSETNIIKAVNYQLKKGRYKKEFIYGKGGAGKKILKILLKSKIEIQKKLNYLK